ncbi:MAG: NUDIX domain-containing protein, partial [Verrucomicrobia bacterium]|nr:NUDIX domain-containing protein [Verrucomicrobiota bacterium]
AERIVRQGGPRLINNGLMELGATLCKARNPACAVCPVRAACRATDLESLPRKRLRSSVQARVERYWWFCDGSRVLLEQQPEAGRWGGLWALPAVDAASPQDPSTPLQPWVSLRHHIMRFSVNLQVVRGDPANAPRRQAAAWQLLSSLGELPIPTPHRRAIELAVAAEQARGPQMITGPGPTISA